MKNKGTLVVVSVLVVFGLLLGGFGCAPAPAPEKPIVLKFACPEPSEAADVVQIINPWLNEIEERSGGRVKIERYWVETLVSLPDSYQATVDGVVDIANFFPSLVPGKFPLDEVEFLPPMDVICWRPTRVYSELYQKFPEIGAQYAEVKFLWASIEIGAFIATTEKPVRKLEDCQGLKIVSIGRTMALRAENLGFTPVPIMPLEVYSSLETGIIDAVPHALKSLYVLKAGEITRYLTLVRLSGMIQAYIMNLDKWNSLPPDIQKIIDDVDAEYSTELCDEERWRIHNEALSGLTREFNIEIIELSPEETARWVEADKPVVESYAAELEAKGLPGKTLFEEYYRLERKYSAEEYSFK